MNLVGEKLPTKQFQREIYGIVLPLVFPMLLPTAKIKVKRLLVSKIIKIIIVLQERGFLSKK